MMTRKWGLPGLLLGCSSLILPSMTVMAQDTAESADDEVRVLGIVDVREILPDSVEYAPGAASMLTDHEIEELRPFTLTEALDFLPGVRTVQDDVLNRRSNIGIRGANPRRGRKVLLLEDGMPITASTYLDPDAHYTPPMERLERIDVLKGTGQIIHGPLNNHGIINFRNKRPTPYAETTAEIGVGTPFVFKRHAMHRNTIGDVGFVLSYTGAESDGVFDTEEIQYDDMFGSIHWNPTWNHELTASFTYYRERSFHDERNLSVEEFAIDPRGKLRLNQGAQFNNFSIDYFKGQLTHRYRMTENITLSSMFFVTDMDRPRFQRRAGTGPNDPLFFMRGRERAYRNYGAESRAEFANLNFMGLEHTIQSGIRFERQLFDNINTVGGCQELLDFNNRGNPAVTGFTCGASSGDARQQFMDATAVSGYIQNAMRYGDWTITPGIRVEYFKQERETRYPGPDPEDGSSSHTPLLPGISIFYDGFRDTQVFASVHRGYSPASARSEDFPLTPEIGINSQIGVRSNLFTGVSFEVAGFYNLIQDTIIREPVTDDAFLGGIVFNAGDSSILGVDVGLRFDSSAYYPASPYNLFAMLAYNYSDARFDEGPQKGNRIPMVSLHSGSFTLGLEHTAGWQVSGTVSHLGHFFTDVDNTVPFTPTDTNSITGGRVPSNTLISARASYLLPGTNTTLWIQGRNLTNRVFVTDVNDGLRPGPERTVMIGANVKFF